MTRKESALRFFNQNDPAVKMRIESGIELNRKGNAKIVFKSKNGEELPENITVKVNQLNHEFKFGANIFMLDEFESDDKNATYREKFPEVFNLATVPFYWKDLEPEQGKPRYAADSYKIYRRPAPDLCVNYCKEKGIEPKCHCLNYDTISPDWYVGLPVTQCKEMLLKRFHEIADRYKEDIPTFEVTNETLKEGHSKFFYEDDFIEWSFKQADRIFPNNKLIINDYNYWTPNATNRANYYMQIERLINSGHRVDSIGLQFHMFFPKESEHDKAASKFNPEVLFKTLDNYARFGIPVQITEMTLPAYTADAEDEEVQAELVKNIYTLFFSHPAMEAIIYWNFVDGYAASAAAGDMTTGENKYYGGLLRHDLSEKPAYTVLKKLVNEEWHTQTEVTAVGDTAKFRGFYGDYELTICVDGKETTQKIKLSKESKNIFTIEI